MPCSFRLTEKSGLEVRTKRNQVDGVEDVKEFQTADQDQTRKSKDNPSSTLSWRPTIFQSVAPSGFCYRATHEKPSLQPRADPAHTRFPVPGTAAKDLTAGTPYSLLTPSLEHQDDSSR